MVRKNPVSNIILCAVAFIILLAGYIFCCAYSVFSMSANMIAIEMGDDGAFREVFSFTWLGFLKASTCLPTIIFGALALGMTLFTAFKPSQRLLVKTGIVYVIFMVSMFISLSELGEYAVARQFSVLVYFMKGTGFLFRAFKFILPIVAFCVYCENILLFAKRAKKNAAESDEINDAE